MFAFDNHEFNSSILSAAVGQVQQLVSGGQVIQIVSTPQAPSASTVSGNNATASPVRHSASVSARSKQPQLRPKPANNSSPGPVQQSQVAK